ncbi:MAG: serine/threonine protein kinase [Fuerstiella sp.]|nr:serine/threonine protein kinase [Fuerstiella sp.]
MSDTQLIQCYEHLLETARVVWSSERPLIRLVGSGGQGSVFLSHRRGSDDFTLPVALKIFSPAAFKDIESYEHEMRRVAGVAAQVARVQHDNLIDVHNVITQDRIHMMEMEWLDGYDLQHLLLPDALQEVRRHVTEHRWRSLNQGVVTAGREHSRLKPGIAVGVIKKCLSGLAALHREGIVHGDLKPSNIMLKRSGNVKIVDIGSAYENGRPPHGSLCTPAYAAPEVLQGQVGSPASDLASLGYVLIELISGIHPFENIAYEQLIQAKHTISDRLPHILPTEEFAYSELLLTLIGRLIDPDPQSRFSSAESAELSDDGTAGFLRELVKGDLDSDCEAAIRNWIAEIESDTMFSKEQVNPLSSGPVNTGTTRSFTS